MRMTRYLSSRGAAYTRWSMQHILLYAVVDMQYRLHIDTLWYRGKEASISNGEITCLLDRKRPYDLGLAYEKRPAIALMNLKCDEDWIPFVNL